MRLLWAPVAIQSTAGGHGSTTSAYRAADPTVDRASSLKDPAPRDSLTATDHATAYATDDQTSSLTPGTSYVVEPGDTLWSIAEHQLGSPLRWPEIVDLNYGRIQRDGGELSNAHWIYPGWELVLPATPAPASSSSVNTGAPVTAPDEPTADRTVPSASRVAGVLLSGGAEEPSRNGQATGVATIRVRDQGATEGRAAHHQQTPVPAGVIGFGVLGAGVVALLEGMRRVQRRRRPVGLRIALPEGDLAALERRLRVDADPEGVDVIDLGLRAFVVSSLRSETMPPRAAVVRLRPDALEIELEPSSSTRMPPPPFTADGRSTSWFLSREGATLQALRDDPDVMGSDAPFPALVTVGHDERGVVLVDVEQAGSIDATGVNVVGILGTVAVEMATARWADQVDLILVGFDEGLEALDRISHVATIADVLSKVQRRVRERRALLASVGREANWEIRWIDGGDAWDLCVVLCAPDAVAADPDGAAVLIRLAGSGGTGLAVVAGADTGLARWHLDVGSATIELKDAMTTSVFTSPPVDSQLPMGVASLVRIAAQMEGVPITQPPYDKLGDEGDGIDRRGPVPMGEAQVSRHEELRVTDPPPPIDDRCEVEVRVLGPIEIFGASRPFTRAWAVELIVYLAMHRKGASSDQWATALWPDRIMAAASLHSTASAARRSLGVSISGEDHLPRAHGRLCLGRSVGSDWSRFVELSDRTDPASWRKALELIRGRPFEGLRAPDWVLLEGIAANVEASVVDLASRNAEYCLSVGDPAGAEWSARQGLLVSVYDERLYRLLLRAADAAGNPAGVESVMAELVRLVADDVEPYDAVHPETLDLYRVLSRRPAPTVNR
jgi:hypothetical protein